MTTEQDQLLHEKQNSWAGFSRLLFWGTIGAALCTLAAVLFAI